jgi:hypothetical protein
MDTDKRYFTTDTLDSTVYQVDEDGDPIGDDDFQWDEQTKVTIDNGPWVERFDTDEFYKLEYAVAKPLEQTYVINDEEYTFTKPRDELQKASWALDNLPWTIHHPDTGSVVDATDVRGFWRGPEYKEDVDEQRLHLYVPTNDEEALEFIDEYKATSVGFTNKLVLPSNYSGEVGGDVDLDQVDAFQTDIHYDHVASVERGRFPREEGGGLVLDSDMELVDGTNGGGHDEGGRGTVVQNNGDESDTLESTSKDNNSTTNMTDTDISDLNLDTIVEENDEVEQLVEEKEEYEQRVDALSEKKSELEQRLEATEDTVDGLKEDLAEYKMSERQELVDSLTDLTDYWDEDEMLDADEGPTLDTLEERIEMMEDLRDETQTTTTVDDDGATENGDGPEDKYDGSGPIDLSETA